MENLGNLILKKLKIIHLGFKKIIIMECYYTKKEFNEMKSSLEKKIKSLEKQIEDMKILEIESMCSCMC
jgi:prefoldin subunit 5